MVKVDAEKVYTLHNQAAQSGTNLEHKFNKNLSITNNADLSSKQYHHKPWRNSKFLLTPAKSGIHTKDTKKLEKQNKTI